MKKKTAKILLLFLLAMGLFYRLYGLGQNYSFWTDENHVAIFSRAILERGRPVLANGYHTGAYQWLLYWLGAISAKIFGLNEFALRFPAAIFGVLAIGAVYLLGKKIFNRKVGFIAAFFTAFLNIEILFSRQVRPYQALQFFYVLSAYFLYQASNLKLQTPSKFWQSKFILGFLACGLLASLFHGLGLVIFLNGFLFLFITNFKNLKKWLPGFILLAIIFGYFFRVQLLSLLPGLGKINNFFYYRVFLTHNYLPLTLLAGVGGLSLLINRHRPKENQKKLLLFIIFLGIQTMIVSFLLGQPFTRYFYPVFPFIILLAAYGLSQLSLFLASLISQFQSRPGGTNFCFFNFSERKRANFLISVPPWRDEFLNFLISLFLFFILIALTAWQGKISLLPQKIYSLNADMQEIPEVDWKKIYQFTGEKLAQNPQAILITNWNDLPVWYLGENLENLYLAREEGQGSLMVDPVSGGKMIYSLENLDKLVKENPQGIAIFDSWDNYLLEGAHEYAQKNFKKEMEVDRLYPVQPRFWPVNVYSWGME